MRKQHQQIIYITILLCLVSTFAYSQKPCPLYDKAMNAGKTAAKAENYQFAINKFLVAQVAARECNLATKAPSEELNKIFNKLEQQKRDAEKAKNKAIKARKQAEIAKKKATAALSLAQRNLNIATPDYFKKAVLAQHSVVFG